MGSEMPILLEHHYEILRWIDRNDQTRSEWVDLDKPTEALVLTGPNGSIRIPHDTNRYILDCVEPSEDWNRKLFQVSALGHAAMRAREAKVSRRLALAQVQRAAPTEAGGEGEGDGHAER